MSVHDKVCSVWSGNGGVSVYCLFADHGQGRAAQGDKAEGSGACDAVLGLCIGDADHHLFFQGEREQTGMDLELFSTWGINDRNNAYVVENVLLFIPYGFLGAWTSGRLRRILLCGVFGFLTSVGIESLQLVTRRGFFQIDDILTNTLGTVIGCGIFCIIFHNNKD